MTHADPLLDLLHRAAEGDQQAAAGFRATRNALLRLQGRLHGLGRKRALHTLHQPSRED